MKKIIQELSKVKPIVKITLSTGQILNFNMKLYTADVEKYENAVEFNFKNSEYIIIKYSDIVVISYTTTNGSL